MGVVTPVLFTARNGSTISGPGVGGERRARRSARWS